MNGADCTIEWGAQRGPWKAGNYEFRYFTRPNDTAGDNTPNEGDKGGGGHADGGRVMKSASFRVPASSSRVVDRTSVNRRRTSSSGERVPEGHLNGDQIARASQPSAAAESVASDPPDISTDNSSHTTSPPTAMGQRTSESATSCDTSGSNNGNGGTDPSATADNKISSQTSLPNDSCFPTPRSSDTGRATPSNAFGVARSGSSHHAMPDPEAGTPTADQPNPNLSPFAAGSTATRVTSITVDKTKDESMVASASETGWDTFVATHMHPLRCETAPTPCTHVSCLCLHTDMQNWREIFACKNGSRGHHSHTHECTLT